MKAMILAAGFGTRLLPYTQHTPKPLFPVGGKPILDITIEKLVSAGCRGVVVNTHHLHRRIEDHLAAHRLSIPVRVSYEPEILGTGGALRKAADYLGAAPFVVVNGDIVFDVDLYELYRTHMNSGCPVTMVLCRRPEFDSVRVSAPGRVIGFADRNGGAPTGSDLYTFTGIHVVDPAVLARIPENRFHDIIETYKEIIAEGKPILARIVPSENWDDIGAPERYQRLAYSRTAPEAFERAFSFRPAPEEIGRFQLAGDGSDRKWFRLSCRRKSLILADHGIRPGLAQSEADAYTAIGNHLREKGVPVPEIVLPDTFSGLIYVSDLGDRNLQSAVSGASRKQTEKWYGKVIEHWCDLAIEGCKDFRTEWTYQTPRYDRTLILQKECRYFVEAFLNGLLNMSVDYGALAEEFEAFADAAERFFLPGLIHRDLQSRNILLHRQTPYFIDFQGARPGPVQYDLASLLIDPYVRLDIRMQQKLYVTAAIRLSERLRLDAARFETGYRCCSLSRNLQALGAFGHLTRVKQKPGFAPYIPPAVESLKHQLDRFDIVPLPGLKRIVRRL